MLHANDAWRGACEKGGALLLVLMVSAQAVLGIVTLLQRTPLPLALAHQMLAILVLTVAVMHAQRLSQRA
jgi:cytochrome c oxidase assembly protein subunit 15